MRLRWKKWQVATLPFSEQTVIPKIKQLTADFQKRLLTCRQQRRASGIPVRREPPGLAERRTVRALQPRDTAKIRPWALAVDTAPVIRPISKVPCHPQREIQIASQNAGVEHPCGIFVRVTCVPQAPACAIPCLIHLEALCLTHRNPRYLTLPGLAVPNQL